MHKEAPEAATLARIFIRHVAERHGRASIEAIKTSLERTLRHFGPVTLAELTPARIREFAAKLEAEGLSAGYRRRILGDFAAAMNRAFKDGEIATPPPHVPLPPEGPGNNRVASIAELTELFRAAKHPHALAYLMVALGTAARPAAILDLDKAQCNLADRTIELLPPGRTPDPRKRRPTVPMCQALAKFISGAPAGHLVPSRASRLIDQGAHAQSDQAGGGAHPLRCRP